MWRGGKLQDVAEWLGIECLTREQHCELLKISQILDGGGSDVSPPSDGSGPNIHRFSYDEG